MITVSGKYYSGNDFSFIVRGIMSLSAKVNIYINRVLVTPYKYNYRFEYKTNDVITSLREFSSMIGLGEIRQLKCSDNVTNLAYLFANNGNLTDANLEGMNTSNVTLMTNMLLNCKSLKNIKLSSWNTSNVTSMYAMFNYCSQLVSLNLQFDTRKVVDMDYMFYGCTALKSLDITNFQIVDTCKAENMLRYCNALVTLRPPSIIAADLDLSETIIDATSVNAILDNLATVSGTKTLTLGSTLLAKADSTKITTAQSKGWTIV